MLTAVIIEDEPKAAQEIRDILSIVRPGMKVVAVIGSVDEAVTWFQRNPPPDLVFSDIQLSDGVSFDIYRQVTISTPVIFCTAFDEYMLNAFEANGIAYLLKPVVKAKVEEALQKYDQLRSSFTRNDALHAVQLSDLINQIRPVFHPTLLLHVRDKIVPVKTDEIAFLHYNNGVVSVNLFSGRVFFVEEQMEGLEKKLNPAHFYRVNRQFIIQRSAVEQIERYFSRKLSVKLIRKVPEPVIVGKLKVTAFLEWLEKSPAGL